MTRLKQTSNGEDKNMSSHKARRSWVFKSKKANEGSQEIEESSVNAEKTEPLKQLPSQEREILERQLYVPEASVNYISLYRYASRKDLAIIIFGCICAIIGGALLPMFTVVFGQLAGTFQGFANDNADVEEFYDDLNSFTLYFIYLGIGQFITIYLGTVCLIYSGEAIARKTRGKYLEAILRQNIGFFDELGAGEITTRITGDTNLIQDGISQKVALTLQSLSTFITAFIIGFVMYWKLTLILTSTVVAISTTFGLGSVFLVTWTKKALDAYANGGTVAEEAFSSIRNAVAFGTEDKLTKQYDKALSAAEKQGRKNRVVTGLMIGCLFMFINLNYGLAFWMGSRFIVNGEVELSAIITVLFAIIFGAFSLGSVGPYIQNFSSAVAAAKKIFGTIDRSSPLDPQSEAGDKAENLVGNIALHDVKHIYPSRPEVTVLKNVNVNFPAGKITAIVGASGSGKSSIIALIERFYEPVGGYVSLDGKDLRELNIQWLRQQMSLVSQEPILFAVTIYENIRFGVIGSPFESLPERELREIIYEAARKANAHDFINALPEGYETNVGDRGFLLSGGQKQRIAIARAIVSDPRILLLDEATSALDTKSEGVVQAALERASQGRTTIVIAHRLSTIKDSDNIVVMSDGYIMEQGSHEQLLSKRGTYYELVHAQEISEAVGNTSEAAEDVSEDSINMLQKTVTKDHKIDEKNVISTAAEDSTKLVRSRSAKSLNSLRSGRKEKSMGKKYPLWTLIRFIFRFNRKERVLLFVGFVFCLVSGGIVPTQSVLFGNAIQALSRPPSQYRLLRSEANYWSRWYLILGIIALFAYAGQLISFGLCAEKLIHRSRERSFRYILRQDLVYFDHDENSAGALTSLLSTETQAMEGLSGSTLGSFLSSLTTVVAALAVGISFGWKMGLVCAATIPVLLGCGFFRFYMLQKEDTRVKAAYASSANYACEATSAVRTVASLTRERDVWQNYRDQLIAQGKKNFRSVARSSMLYAASESLTLFATALAFWYGGRLIGQGEYDILTFFIVFAAVVFSAQSAGTAFSFSPDISKAVQAAGQLKKLFDRVPDIDVWSSKGKALNNVEGSLEFKDVYFRYPTRPEQPVLQGLSIAAKPGQLVALVGASGCGKSTVIALIERFYDPNSGDVCIDGEKVKDLMLKEYRQHLALVSQEPTLYQGSIRDNIMLGTDKVDIPEERITAVCKEANIYDFIMSLPDGFNTICGSKGTLLSGGQKQRIAIARALLRDPKVLLLDEATSALDSESEKVVQAALDAAAKGRTTITVAHRLSTIQNADVIYVLDGGKVVESGRHQDLLAKKGRYFELVQLQSLKRAEE